MADDTILAGLTASQERAVTHPSPTLAVEAGAGSGKTRVLTRRIAHRVATGEIDPRHVLAITFTRKAATELAERLRGLGLRDTVTAGTFHGVAYAQLRARWQDRNIEPPTLLDRKVGLVARLLPGAGSSDGGSASEVSPVEVVSEIEWAKARLVSPTHYPAVANAEVRRTPLPYREIADVYRRYEAEKRRRRMVDFDDLLRLCCHDLNEDREFAAAQHWRHRHLFVDEFQDMNPRQFALLQAWMGPRNDITVVGDPNQAIYGWNGADAAFLTDFGDHFPGAETVVLDQNHRSTPQVLRAANAVLVGRGGPPVLHATRPDGPEPSIHAYDDDLAEAEGIARAIRDHRRPGSPWSAQAVLVRTHAQALVIQQALRAAGIPHRVRGRSAIADDAEARKILRRMAQTHGAFLSVVADLEGEIEAQPGEASDRESTVQNLVRLAHDYAATDPHPTVEAFEVWLRDSRGSDDGDDGKDAVDLCTFHAAKGLEWPTVHLAGLEHGLVPIGHAKTSDAQAEERRLLYVAITRAQQQLSCSWARERTFGSRTVRRQPSPYLVELEPETVASTTASPAAYVADSKARLRAVDGAKGRPARDVPADADLTPRQRIAFVALKEWRSATARAASVPAYIVFDDRTLAEVARRGPRTHDDLLDVPGIGPVKASRYGDALLLLVRQHRAS